MVLNILCDFFFLVGDLISLLLGSSPCGLLSKSIKKQNKTANLKVSLAGEPECWKPLCSAHWPGQCQQGGCVGRAHLLTLPAQDSALAGMHGEEWPVATCLLKLHVRVATWGGSAQLESWNSMCPFLAGDHHSSPSAYCKAPSFTSCISFHYFQQILFM